jgi:hypothetical protein
MNILSTYGFGLFLLCAVCWPARSQEQPTRLMVTEGHYIGYTSVADALATLESKGLTGVPALHGDVSFVEPGSRTAWTFAGKDNPAYPSAKCRVNEGTMKCGAAPERNPTDQ